MINILKLGSLELQGLYLEFENGYKNLTWSLEFSTRIVFGILKWMQDSKGQDPRCLCKSYHELVPLAYKYASTDLQCRLMLVLELAGDWVI